jgi:CRISPR/Cas system-associated endonuclease/helicase Cas3
MSLLHAGFIYRHRREKENGENGILKKQHGVWITTQIAEVSLNIDFNVMVTELSSIDSQIQRWGRIWRLRDKEYNNKEPNVYICSNEPVLFNLTITFFFCRWSLFIFRLLYPWIKIWHISNTIMVFY